MASYIELIFKQMLFLIFLHFSISYQFFDFTLTNPPETLVLYFKALEKIDILLEKGNAVLFSKLNDELYVEIYASAKGENETHYGPFSSGSGLGGIYFDKKNITIHFSNDSPNPTKLGLYIAGVFGQFTIIPSYDFEFPILSDPQYMDKVSHLSELQSPMIYYFEKKSSYAPILAITIILAVLSIYGITPTCRFL